MPWKNGGGETTEILADPEGAGLEDFGWRLSAARVAQDGPFSLFPGIDRTLAVLSGEGLELATGGATVRLTPGDRPFSFRGDERTDGSLLAGPIDDLNIMTRRGTARHRMKRVRVEGDLGLDVAAATMLLFCAEGRISLDDESLGPRDTAVFVDRMGRVVRLDGQGVLFAIEIERDA